MHEQAREVVGRRVAGSDGHFDFGARFGLLIALRSLVGDEIAFADAPQPQRLIGGGEVAIGCVEVVIRVGARWLLDGAPGTQLRSRAEKSAPVYFISTSSMMRFPQVHRLQPVGFPVSLQWFSEQSRRVVLRGRWRSSAVCVVSAK